MTPPLVIGAVCLCLTVALSIVVARVIGGRIQSVQSHVTRIAAGDFEPVPTSTMNDELHDLSDGVNRMAAALGVSMRNIRESERSALLTQLVGGLAHQLRNALTGARMSVQVHRRHCPKSGDEAIDVALKQLTLTEEQIKALLRLSRGESRPPVAGYVVKILDEAAALLTPVCTHQKIRFNVQREELELRVADADAMRGAILNLGMNAIEAAGPGGAVSIMASTSPDQLVIEVVDNGPGVPENLRDDVFAPFFTTKQEGAGLGLALARRAAEDCGGTLTLHREEGLTTFRLTIRAARPEPAAQDAAPWVDAAAPEAIGSRTVPSSAGVAVEGQ
jgi:signal transduction histidine kinase